MAKNKNLDLGGKTVDEVLETLNEEQKKAVAIFVALAVQKEIESMTFDDED